MRENCSFKPESTILDPSIVLAYHSTSQSLGHGEATNISRILCVLRVSLW